MTAATDATLGDGARALAEAARAARAWVADARGNAVAVANESVGLTADTRRAESVGRRLAQAAGRRNCVGVFGPSQAGKSYLVSALARQPGGALEADFAGARKNFLTDINPPGDRESTGLVTRFTARGAANADREFPVVLRLLSETDLVRILANSFFADFDPNNATVRPPDEDAVRRALDAAAAAATATPAAHLDDIALYDLGDYFQRNFSARVEGLGRAGYWDGLIAHAGRLTLEARADLYAQLWGRLDAFTDLFKTLARWLDRLGHAATAQAGLAALVPRERSIIDVAVLNGLGQTDGGGADTVAVRTGAAPIAVPRAVLAALVAEIEVAMVDTPWPFFDHTDLLDFPGARSRLKLIALPDAPDDCARQVRELFLRGKIAYLFQRYAEERELTAMLLCMPPSVAEVKDLAPMVRAWVDLTQGASAAERQRSKTALFLVLTKFDMEFIEKGGETAESRKGKWDRRLHASLLELYGKDDWCLDWDGKPFRNTVFLRNPGMKQAHLMAYRDQSLDEVGIAAGAVDAVAAYRAAFVASELCGKHVADRAAVWEAAFALNDGGVSYLVAKLDALLDPDLKARQVAGRLREEGGRLAQGFGRFYHAGADRGRREKDEQLVALRDQWGAAMVGGERNKFAVWLDCLALPEGEARGVFLNVAGLKIDPAPAAKKTVNLWGTKPADTAPAAVTDRAAIYADTVIGHWTARLRQLSRRPGVAAFFDLPAQAIDDLVQEAIVGAVRLGLKAAIADMVRRETDAATVRWHDVADRIAGRTALMLGDYVAYLGFGGVPARDRPAAHGAPDRPIFALPAPHDGLPRVGAEKPGEDSGLSYPADWGVAFRDLGLANLSFDGGREITEAQNRTLGDILGRIAQATGAEM